MHKEVLVRSGKVARRGQTIGDHGDRNGLALANGIVDAELPDRSTRHRGVAPTIGRRTAFGLGDHRAHAGPGSRRAGPLW